MGEDAEVSPQNAPESITALGWRQPGDAMKGANFD